MRLMFMVFLSVLFFKIFAAKAPAEITSWVDENGVRHFSNTGAPSKNSTVKTAPEKKPDPPISRTRKKPEKKGKPGVLKMYENDRKRDAERKREAFLKKAEAKAKKENAEYDRRWKRKQELLKKGLKKK